MGTIQEDSTGSSTSEQVSADSFLGRLTIGSGFFADLAGIAQLGTQSWLGGLITGAIGIVLGGVGLFQQRGRQVGRAVYFSVSVLAVGCLTLSFCFDRLLLVSDNYPEGPSSPGHTAAPTTGSSDRPAPSANPSTTSLPSTGPQELTLHDQDRVALVERLVGPAIEPYDLVYTWSSDYPSLKVAEARSALMGTVVGSIPGKVSCEAEINGQQLLEVTRTYLQKDRYLCVRLSGGRLVSMQIRNTPNSREDPLYLTYNILS